MSIRAANIQKCTSIFSLDTAWPHVFSSDELWPNCEYGFVNYLPSEIRATSTVPFLPSSISADIPGPKKVWILLWRSVHISRVISFFVSNSKTNAYFPSLDSSLTAVNSGVNLHEHGQRRLYRFIGQAKRGYVLARCNKVWIFPHLVICCYEKHHR